MKGKRIPVWRKDQKLMRLSDLDNPAPKRKPEESELAQLVADVLNRGYIYDPGHSDLDNDQPIDVRMTLGEYRAIKALVAQARTR